MRRRFQKILPSPLIRGIYIARNWMSLNIARAFSAHPVLSSAYYLFFSRRFDREHRSVLHGRAAYLQSTFEPGASSALLRRNTHRLEKGLIMRPRRPIFGEDFIEETVDIYNRAQCTSGFSTEELRWATDVLDEYFEIVSETPKTLKAKNIFLRARRVDPKDTSAAFRPCKLNALHALEIGYENILTLFQRRKSVRWYLDKPVPCDLIQKAINAAAFAPSACNRQPYRFIVAEKENASALAMCAGGTTGFAENVPALLVVVGDLSAFPSERDRHLIYIDSALASMQLMLAAETLGLSTCPINWPDVDRAEKRIRKLLKLLVHERVILLIAIGYGDPAGGIPYSQKKQDGFIADIMDDS